MPGLVVAQTLKGVEQLVWPSCRTLVIFYRELYFMLKSVPDRFYTEMSTWTLNSRQ